MKNPQLNIKKFKKNSKKIQKKLNSTNDSLKVIFVLGESVRADHMQLNGYNRETNPLLSRNQNVLSFSNALTTNYYTAVSVPQILSNASIYDTYSTSKISLIDVLNQAGIQTTWIGNQTPEKSFLPFINQTKKTFFVDPIHSEFSFHKTLDENLLTKLGTLKFQEQKSEFILLHMMGSHWWYENRYDDRFRKFLPTIKSKYVPSNSSEEMINSYDNTILYLDYFLDKLIKKIENSHQNIILIYVSDHGELLGENGKWLHAQTDNPNPLKNPAVVIWYSEKFKNKYPKKIKSLICNKNKKLPLDFVFNSLVELYGIKEVEIKGEMNIFNTKLE